MPNYARIAVGGHLGSQPEIPEGKAFAVASIATTTGRGEHERTSWRRLIVFAGKFRSHERFALLPKGASVHVEGREEIEEWVDQDGGKRTTVKILVDTFHEIAPYRGDAPVSSSEPNAPPPPVIDDDIPF